MAKKCKHTCCSGWKMNIDQKTLSEYKNNTTPFSQTLKKGVNFKKSQFKSDKAGRCAFLNNDGLCALIINLGEESLCQVCRDHPRFRSFYNDRTETGLGFCCEEATKIILNFKDKLQPILLTDDQTDCELDFNQKNLLEFRMCALDIVQDRTLDINERIKKLLSLCNADVCYKDFGKILKTFLSFERLDKDWIKRLKSIKNAPSIKPIDQSLSIPCEQFLANEIFRHVPDAEDTMWVRARVIASLFAWWIIKSIYDLETLDKADLNTLIDVVRAYSAEVEYSEKNLDKLFNFSYKFIKL